MLSLGRGRRLWWFHLGFLEIIQLASSIHDLQLVLGCFAADCVVFVADENKLLQVQDNSSQLEKGGVPSPGKG